MILRTIGIVAFLVTLPAMGEEIPVPSGQMVTYYDIVRDQPGPFGLTYRFRFIAPQIGRDGAGLDIETAGPDMDFLCKEYALPRLSVIGPVPAQVVITLSDRPVEFGTATPEVTQFFEAYRIEDDTCIWEGF